VTHCLPLSGIDVHFFGSVGGDAEGRAGAARQILYISRADRP
jgi:hypothetical protein